MNRFCDLAGRCQNGGTCVTTDAATGAGTCTCTANFSGQVCDIQTGGQTCMAATTCNNHGICLNNICLCFAGFSGAACT